MAVFYKYEYTNKTKNIHPWTSGKIFLGPHLSSPQVLPKNTSAPKNYINWSHHNFPCGKICRLVIARKPALAKGSQITRAASRVGNQVLLIF